MALRQMEGITGIIQKRRRSEVDARLVVSASQASGKSLSSFARKYGLRVPAGFAADDSDEAPGRRGQTVKTPP